MSSIEVSGLGQMQTAKGVDYDMLHGALGRLIIVIDGKYGCRLLRLSRVEDFSIHDIALVDGKSVAALEAEAEISAGAEMGWHQIGVDLKRVWKGSDQTDE